MPGFDGTGPRGMGPAMNRGSGRCMAGRRGLGVGPRAAGMAVGMAGISATSSVDERIAALERELAELKAQRGGAA